MEREEIMDLGSGKPAEQKKIMDLGSGNPAEPKKITDLVSGELHDYPFVRRLRNRRLLIYLWIQGFDTAYDSVVHESGVQMSRLHLRQLVIWGQWSEAFDYISRFLPSAHGDRGLQARSILFFLHTLRALANVAVCSTAGLVNDSFHSDLRFLTTLSGVNAKLSSILRYTLHSPQFRESLDWMLVRKKASLIVDDWALEAPDLMRNLQLPGGPGLPQDLLPIGPLCPRRHWREQSRRPKPSTIAKYYLKRRKSLASSILHPGLPEDALGRVADVIEECLRAGKLPELHQGRPLESNEKEGPIKHSRKDGWYTNSAGQDSIGRGKNTGEDLMTEEDGPDRKRQLTKLELNTEVEAGSCSANLMAN